jgi:PAS domain S-box-containing protein
VVSHAFGQPFWHAYLGWWTSDGLGLLMVAPLIVTVLHRVGTRPASASPSLWERGLFLAAWCAAGWTVFHLGTIGSVFVPLPYAMLALLTWAGLRLGQSTVAVAICILLAAASTTPLVGSGPFPLGGADPHARLLLMQAFLAVTAATGLLLAASRRETSAALDSARDGQERIQSLADHLPGGMVFQLTAEEGGLRFAYVSAGVDGIAGMPASAVRQNANRFFDLIHPDDRPQLRALERDALSSTVPFRTDVRLVRLDGDVRWVTFSCSPRIVAGDRVVWDGILVDVTDQRRSEEAVRASEARIQETQRIELVGQLAGGVAHDFNNLLTVIMGHADLLLSDDVDDVVRGPVGQIAEAARRASLLTQQLLAFGRKTMLTPVTADLNDIVRRTLPLLEGTLNEAITVRLATSPEELRLNADRNQIERVLMNLALNARDAMPDGGSLDISTGPVTVSQDSAQKHGVRQGPYVWIAVTDTGMGMSADLRARLFQPFFTTKPVGRGSGLGLAAVHGVVRQSQGFIEVESAPGRGSTFTVFLPAHDGPLEAARANPAGMARGTETILIVEDDSAVRLLAESTLQRLGYAVLTAGEAEAAVKVAVESRLDLVVSDVMMPGMAGPDLVAILAGRQADLKVLFISGHSDDAVLRRGVETGAANFLQKPFTAAAFAAKVREVLDGAWAG